MTSNVSNYSQNIDTNFPVQGQDNPSQGFRDNFAQIRMALETASQELSELQYSSTASSYNLPIATSTRLGGVRIGANISIVPNGVDAGTISVAAPYVLPVADSSTLGGVKQGANVTIGGDGTISVATPYVLPTATDVVVGGIRIGGGLVADSEGVVSLDTTIPFPYAYNTATVSSLGAVKIGANISIDGEGIISVTAPYVLPIANNSILGGVLQGDNVNIAPDGRISVAAPYVLPQASNSILGGVKIGDNISIDVDGVISVATPYVLPLASTSTLGGVIAGDNVTIDSSGVISVTAPYVLPIAAPTVLGGVKQGNNITIDGSGFISATVNTATNITAGIVKIGNNITTDEDGTISVEFVDTNSSIIPRSDVTYDLGSSARRWRDLYLSSSTIYLGSATITTQDGNIFIPDLKTSKLGVVALGPVIDQITQDGESRYTVDRTFWRTYGGLRGPYTITPTVEFTNQSFYDGDPSVRQPRYEVELDNSGYITDIVIKDPGYFPDGSFNFVQDGIHITPANTETVTLVARIAGIQSPINGTYTGQFNGNAISYVYGGSEPAYGITLTGEGSTTTFAGLNSWRLPFGYYVLDTENFTMSPTDETSIGQGSPVIEIVGSLDYSYLWPEWTFFGEEVRSLSFNDGTTSITQDANVGGKVITGEGVQFPDGTVQTSAIPVLPSYTTAQLATNFSTTATGTFVFVTNAPGGAQPCYFNGTSWKTVAGTTI
jgi:hypothetical protein